MGLDDAKRLKRLKSLFSFSSSARGSIRSNRVVEVRRSRLTRVWTTERSIEDETIMTRKQRPRKAQRIRFSEYVQPQVRAENHLLDLNNLTSGTERLQYFRGLSDVINRHLENGHLEIALLIKNQSMFGQFIDIRGKDGSFLAAPRKDIKLIFDFNLENMGILLADGRSHSLSDMSYIESGTQTPQLSMVFQSLAQGLTVPQLLEAAATQEIDFDRGLIDRWLDDGILELVPPKSDPPVLAERPSSLTWLGHAMVMFRGGGKTIFVDPVLRPRVDFTGRSRCFSEKHAEARLVQDYGPAAVQYTRANLPVPDAVFITHQDVDHFDLATLLALPPSTTIYVPDNDPSHPWEVDLPTVIKDVLGETHTVVKMRHGAVVELGPLRVTAFPFSGEFPESLPHAWNCYLVETGGSAVVLTADSGIAPKELEFIEERVARSRSSLLMSYGIFEEADQLLPYSEDWVHPTGGRLWQWHTKIQDLFAPRKIPAFGVLPRQLSRLVERAGLKYFMPYSRGSTPVCRLADKVFSLRVQSMSLVDLVAQEEAAVATGVRVPAIRYGIPFPLE